MFFSRSDYNFNLKDTHTGRFQFKNRLEFYFPEQAGSFFLKNSLEVSISRTDYNFTS